MADHPNAQMLREGYAAFSAGDIPKATENWADDIVWHVSGTSPISGDYKGQEEIVGFFGKLVELTGGNFTIEVHDIIANDEHGVALVHETAERDGKRLSIDSVHVFHLRDGKATEFWATANDQAAEDAFWA